MKCYSVHVHAWMFNVHVHVTFTCVCIDRSTMKACTKSHILVSAHAFTSKKLQSSVRGLYTECTVHVHVHACIFVHVLLTILLISRTGSKLGISPLMLAAMNGHTSTVKLLLDMGSDINAQVRTST